MYRIDMHRAFAEKVRKQYSTLDEILGAGYTTELPSVVKAILDADEPILNVISEREIKPDIEPSVSDGADRCISPASGHEEDSPPESEHVASKHPYEINYVLERLFGDNRHIDSRQSRSYSTSEVDLDDMELVVDLGEPVSQIEDSESPFAPLVPQSPSQSPQQYNERMERLPISVGERESNDNQVSGVGALIISGHVRAHTNNVAETSVTAIVPPPSNKKITPCSVSEEGEGNTINSSPDDEHCKVVQGLDTDWNETSGGSEPNHSSLQRPRRSHHLDSSSSLRDQAPETPTEAHLAAAARLAPNELLQLLNDFLEYNNGRLKTFCTRRLHYQEEKYPNSNPTAIEDIFNSVWDDQHELDLLTDAVLWIDALLSPFRAKIFAEDRNQLRPRIESIVRQSKATKIPSRSGLESKLHPEERINVDRYAKQIADVQASNTHRKYLLEHTNIDVATFENLLQSAETIRHRRDLGREYGQKDDLVDGLRRIYSTICCSISVSPSETDVIDQPTPARRAEQYGLGPFDPYKLPSRPELFDHESIVATRITAKDYTGIQLSEYQTPLSSEYWRNMHRAMKRVVEAQRQDEIGQAKLRKDANSMNRDFDAFYTPIYGREMDKYAIAASQRIEEEGREDCTESGIPENALPIAQGIHHVANLSPNDQPDHLSLAQNSPRLSDRTDFSDGSLEINLGTQIGQSTGKKGYFCMFVNKYGGCQDWDSCGYKSHDNAGRECQHKENCIFGETCAFVHITQPGTVLPQPNTERLDPSIASADPRTRDLKPILKHVLADPKRYKPCTWVNKAKGCMPKDGKLCTFNHTLEGIVCEAYQYGGCTLEHYCPLRHVYDNISALERSARGHGPAGNNVGADLSAAWAETSSSRLQNRQEYNEIHFRQREPLGLGSDIGVLQSRAPTVSFSGAAPPFAAMENPYQQAMHERDLPSYTPKGPGNHPQSLESYEPVYKTDVLGTKEHFNMSHRNKRKRDEYQGRTQCSNLSLAARMTRNGPNKDGERNESVYDDVLPQGDYSMNLPPEDSRPRKKSKGDGRKSRPEWNKGGKKRKGR